MDWTRNQDLPASRSLRLASPRRRLWTATVLIVMALASATRLGLAVWIAVAGEPGHLGELALAMLAGLPIDAAVAVTVTLPFLLGLLALRAPLRRRWFAWFGHLATLGACCALIFTVAAEFFFWNEFDSRFNGIAVSYLIFPREVIGNIRESFNLTLYLPIVLAIGAAVYLVVRGRLKAALSEPYRPGETRGMLAVGAVALLAAVPVLHFGPLAIGHDREVLQITDNGIRSLFAAFLTNDAEYDGLYATVPEAAALPLLHDAVRQDNTTFLRPENQRSLLRHVDNGSAPKKLNIVLAIEESFGSTFFDGLDNNRPFPISPELTKLAEGGLLFTNIYATGDRTVRGLESLLTSFTPIPGISTARRAGSEGMNSLPFLLKSFGYRSEFLYGGRAVFDNMGHFWSSIGFDPVWDQGDIAEPGFTTIWGAADEFLFGEALRRLDRETRDGQPVFLSLLTVSNHRPYTFPETSVQRDPAKTPGENSARYAAWAFADFVERARSHPWFDDTVFIFIGDHGPRIYGAAEVPVQGFRVPLLYYSPKHIASGRDDTLGSSLDMMPTLLGLLGFSYDSPFFGVDLRRVPTGEGRIAMAHNFAVAFGRHGHLAVLGPQRDINGYDFVPGPDKAVHQPAADPATAAEAVAITQSAHRMFYNREYHELAR
jgi:phosphoglycerol transferase MdoB-like AlkP superfamily enzyme